MKQLVESFSGRRDFIRKASKHLRNAQPERLKSVSDSALEQLIEAGLRGAREYGVQSEFALVEWLELAVVYGVDFHIEEAWARQILSTQREEPIGMAQGNDLTAELYRKAASSFRQRRGSA